MVLSAVLRDPALDPVLGYLGAQPPEGIYVIAGRILTFCYFAYFLILLPLLSRIETPRPIPNSIAEDVLAKTGKQRRRWCPHVIALRSPARCSPEARRRQGRRAGDAAVAEMVVFRSVRQVRSRLVAARLEGLQGSLLRLSRLNYIAFRNLADAGGPGYSEAQAAAFAADYKIKDGPNDQGDMFDRPGRPADYFPAPFPTSRPRGRQWRRRAARPVADHQGALLRARLPAVHVRLLHPVPGAGPELRQRDPAGF
jgi:ubiquinol-cytochrome c reductase cytochrome b/c1 subunit